MSEFCNVVFNLPMHQSYTYRTAGIPECAVGKRIKALFRGRLLEGFVIGLTDEAPQGDFEIREISRVIDGEPVFGDRTLALAFWMSSMYFSSPGEALGLMIPGGKKEMETEGAITFHDVSEYTVSALTADQNRVLAGIAQASEPFFYLHGVTGSGKTHIFLETAKKIYAAGKGVIYLVPEIALTHQVIIAFRNVFGDEIVRKDLALMHSGLTGSQRLKEWMRILRGEARIVVGVRSAVFAPVSSLGLIVIDEEHENTYKAGSTPRYHARQVAMRRVQEEGGLLLMGSATPSVEAYHLMKSGKLPFARLDERASGGKLPAVEVIDMERESGPLSQRLIREIEKTKQEGGQTILFLNRRGFSHFFRCNSCGYEMKCVRCSVALTYHKSRDVFVCHYCGYRARPASVCPSCGSLDVGCLGFGTERIEEDLRRIFSGYSVVRIDTDTVKKKRTLGEQLAAFKEGKIDILLGTQMVAKGLNVRNLALVGVVLADSSLLLPDFRSAERTFNLIVQVGGRAGRFERPGRVLIQTYRASHDAIKLAAQMELDEFYERELEVRRELKFPPYCRLIRLVFRGRDRGRTESAADGFAQLCQTILDQKIKTAGGTSRVAADAEILGPAECPLAMIAHNYRYQLLIRSENFAFIHGVVHDALFSCKPSAGVYIEVDVDPLSLL